MGFKYKHKHQKVKYKDLIIIQRKALPIQSISAKYHISLADFYNFHETGFIIGVIVSAIVVTRRGNSKSVQLGN
jgi:hypothetical protein